jgi:mono/diheme cytochrome c family protein
MLQNFERGGFLLMRRSFIALLYLAVAIAASAQPKSSNASQLSRGKYLVERVGMCGDCHSPRNERGQFVKEQWLAGSPLGFKPTAPIPGWVEVAPGIAGLPGWNEKDAVAFLSTGKGLNGKTAGPPMPEFRFAPADAEAVVAYLKSLKPQPASAGSSKKATRKPGM